MRVFLVLLVLAMATPAAAASFEDLYGWLFAANDRSSSKPRNVEPPLSTSFLADDLGAYTPGELDRLPQIPDPGIPLELADGPLPGMDLGVPPRRVSAPVPEPAAALLFATGAILIARRTRRRA